MQKRVWLIKAIDGFGMEKSLLALRLGITVRTLDSYILGQRKIKIEKLIKLSNALSLSLVKAFLDEVEYLAQLPSDKKAS